MHPFVVVLASFAAAACDPPVRSETEVAVRVGRAARSGQAFETCAATRDCEEPLRCVEATCTSPTTSRMGEYLWIEGRRAVERGMPGAALAAFQQAVAQYEADRQTPPPVLLCDQGALLRRASDAQGGEQAARLLHRCLLGTPPGSRLHETALRELVELEARGLEPMLLARDAPADRYLVNKPTPPSAEMLAVTVARQAPAIDKGYESFARLLEGPAARVALARCFAEQWEKSFTTSMIVALPLKLRARMNDDEQVIGGTLDFPAEPELDANGRCARAALAPLAAEFVKSGASQGNWQGTVSLTVSFR